MLEVMTTTACGICISGLHYLRCVKRKTDNGKNELYK
ncbi:hypothetical protein DJ60_509 [Yersinia enterocolitica]|nr:hypothetical protein CH49_1525 [Yersinia enterocolitica]VTP76228.1 Uncharacterised protein [Yersinia enterocolitica subsp. enterocolitica]KGA70489.1 hypothetical protein DJ59_452 [Yersinia enterocolitica]KGA78337.1 hypothetical protein DJ60_509 [Yersinia enterocolitica]CFQ10952.1 Uncharacterised protein [Yersinia enterocolitica]